MAYDLFLLATLIVNLFFSPNLPNPNSLEVSNNNSDLVLVTRVIDGDTFEIESGQKVRLIGVDSPESVAPGKKVTCFGTEASNYTKSRLEGKLIELKKDVSETDKYHRLLRYVYLDGKLFNDELVREGYALATTFPPDVFFQQMFITSQTFAKDNKKGLWSKCN